MDGGMELRVENITGEKRKQGKNKGDLYILLPQRGPHAILADAYNGENEEY